MAVRLNITMEEELYARLKAELPSRRISAFIGEAVRARLRPSPRVLDAAYKAARKEPWRRELARDWAATEAGEWPD